MTGETYHEETETMTYDERTTALRETVTMWADIYDRPGVPFDGPERDEYMTAVAELEDHLAAGDGPRMTPETAETIARLRDRAGRPDAAASDFHSWRAAVDCAEMGRCSSCDAVLTSAGVCPVDEIHTGPAAGALEFDEGRGLYVRADGTAATFDEVERAGADGTLRQIPPAEDVDGLEICSDCAMMVANAEVGDRGDIGAVPAHAQNEDDAHLYNLPGDDHENNAASRHAARISAMWPRHDVVLYIGDGDDPWFSSHSCDACGSTLGGDRLPAVALGHRRPRNV
jgi:hypothetical protein